VALLFGVEVPVDLGQRLVFGFECQRSESARPDLFDPHQVRHELLEPGPLLVGDLVGTGGVPVDVGQRPLPGFDLGQHVG
jgi:hypothetical protein